MARVRRRRTHPIRHRWTWGRSSRSGAAALGDEHVITHEHQLRTYESDGLLQYAVTPGAVVLPGSHEEVQAVVAACHREGVPWVARGAGSGLSGGAVPVADGRADLAHAHAQRARGGPPEPARGGRARGDERGGLARGGAHALLPARPLQPDRLHDRRQRRRELGRRALLQVRLHHQLRDRPGAGAPRRLARAARGQGARPAGAGPDRRVRRLRGHARRGHEDLAAGGARARRRCARSWRSSARPGRPARWCRRSCPAGSCRAPWR